MNEWRTWMLVISEILFVCFDAWSDRKIDKYEPYHIVYGTKMIQEWSISGKWNKKKYVHNCILMCTFLSSIKNEKEIYFDSFLQHLMQNLFLEK